jgi:hypothetical protein
MKDPHKIAIKASEHFRPSKYATTNPQTIPKGKPFKKIASVFHELGKMPNNNKDPQAVAIKPNKSGARREALASEQIFTPMYFDKV